MKPLAHAPIQNSSIPSRSRFLGLRSGMPWSIGLALLLPGCDPGFAPGSEVSSLRVLAVQVDNPFASPGETVHLQALSYDPEARPITWAWALCAEPASSNVESCLADVARTSAETGTLPLLGMGSGLDNIDLTIAADALDRVPDVAKAQALVGVVSVACPGTLELAPGTAAAQLPFRCIDDQGREFGLDEAIVGVKRVFLREAERNQNPVVEQVLFDGELWEESDVKEVDGCDTEEHLIDDCASSLHHRLQVRVSAASFESGIDEFGRDFREQVIVQHYTEQGIVETAVRTAAESETNWVARSRASGSEIRVWFVVRDDRGGVSWAERRVRVR